MSLTMPIFPGISSLIIIIIAIITEYINNYYHRPLLLSDTAPQISKIKSSGNWKSPNSSSTATAKALGLVKVLLFVTRVSAEVKKKRKHHISDEVLHLFLSPCATESQFDWSAKRWRHYFNNVRSLHTT